MFTFLDLLVVVSMVLMAASFLASVLMFLVKDKRVQRICFYITVALSIYICTVGVRINRFGFEHQVAIAIGLAVVSIAALVLGIVRRNNDKMFLYARIASAAALILGIVNALLV